MNTIRISAQEHGSPQSARLLAAWNLFCATLLVIAIVLLIADRASAGITVAMTQVGNPAFDLVDVNLFSPNFVPSAPFEVDLTILPNHSLFFEESTGNPAVGPLTPHGPPSARRLCPRRLKSGALGLSFLHAVIQLGSTCAHASTFELLSHSQTSKG